MREICKPSMFQHLKDLLILMISTRKTLTSERFILCWGSILFGGWFPFKAVHPSWHAEDLSVSCPQLHFSPQSCSVTASVPRRGGKCQAHRHSRHTSYVASRKANCISVQKLHIKHLNP